MSSNQLQKLSSDLLTIRQAMRLDKPYAWDDVLMQLVTAMGGLFAILLIEFTQLDNRVSFLLGLAPAIVYYCWFSNNRKRNRSDRPSLWQEVKLTLQAGSIVMPFVIGWLAWSRITENIGKPGAGAATFFFVGVGLAYVGLVDVNRRKHLAGSVALIAYGLAIPSLALHQMPFYGALVFIVGGLGGAAIIQWQLKRDLICPTGTDE